jgi:hypothetical protein
MAKKRTAKRASARKGARAKPGSKRRTKKKASRARSARKTLKRVRVAGEKTWEALKSTTAHVVEGVKGKFGTNENGR